MSGTDREQGGENRAASARQSGDTPVRGAFEVDAEATLFGFEPTPAHARIAARSRAWRIGGAARTFGVFAVVAPFVAIIPPHAVWLIGALATGGFLARRRFIERFTLLSLDGTCPKCGAPLEIKSGRLKEPHPLPCETCHHESTLRVPAGTLRDHAVE